MATRMKSNPRESDQQGSDDGLVEDLTLLHNKDPDNIAETLRKRYLENFTYTKVGARVMVAINPLHTTAETEGIEVMKAYADDYHCLMGTRNSALTSHIYQLANTAFFHLKRSAIDQAIMFLGDSGSGKTGAKRAFIQHLGQLRSGAKKEAKLLRQLEEALVVYASFGGALTSDNPTASRFGLYTEIQFDARGRTVGFRCLDYLLERRRVTDVAMHETNFFSFYQLLAGTSAEERSHFQLSQEPSHYAYLRSSRTHASTAQLGFEFKALKAALRTVGFNPKFQSQIFQLLAAVLHLGNIQFANPNHQSGEEVAIVRNFDVLEIAADFLGLHASTLEGLLTYKTKLIKKETCTVFLDADGAREQRDELARCLYGLLFSWMTEHINSRLSVKSQANFMGLLDLPGRVGGNHVNHFQQFCVNYANERLFHYLCYHVYESSNDAYQEDGVVIPHVAYNSNQPAVHLLSRRTSGLVAILHRQANRSRGPASDAALLQAMLKEQEDEEGDTFRANPSLAQFTVRHFFGDVCYSVEGFMEDNMAGVSPDFVQVFRGQGGVATGNPFVSGLFNSAAVTVQAQGQGIVSAQMSGMPLRQPTVRRQRAKGDLSEGRVPCIASQFQQAMDTLFDAFDGTETWFVISLHPGAQGIDERSLLEQVERYGLSNMARRKEAEYTACYSHEDFTSRYGVVLGPMGVDPTRPALQAIEAARAIFGWGTDKLAIGNQYAYLSDDAWRDLEDNLRAYEKGQLAPVFGKDEDARSIYSDDMDAVSVVSDPPAVDFKLTRAANELAVDEKGSLAPDPLDQPKPKTKTRRLWVCCTWALTWWLPGIFLSCCGRMKRPDVRMAWREKVALCIIILFLCLLVLSFVVLFNPLVCPSRAIFSPSEVTIRDMEKEVLSSLYGKVYNLGAYDAISRGHYEVPRNKLLEDFGGKDMAEIFPMQISSMCRRYDGGSISPQVQFTNTSRALQLTRHDHRYFESNEGTYNPNWLQGVINNKLKQVKVGDLAYDATYVQEQAYRVGGRQWVIYRDATRDPPLSKIYDITAYTTPLIIPRPGEAKDDIDEANFLHPDFLRLVNDLNGQDVTQAFDKQLLTRPEDRETKKILKECLDNAFYAGVVDDRRSFRCLFAQYLLLALSIFLFIILFSKFLASLQLGSRPEPEDHDKFVICNVPCYTEDEDSLRLTLESLAALKYDDKRKLLFVISDGMVVGGESDPEALSFVSLGEGMKQHNMGKVYTGLFECKGHVVPYLVVVKVGRPVERAKPGNRGKRDSQMILMRFFNKVHYNYPMVPLELEMYHQIKNIIGVDPHLYEFVLMVDADTLVLPDSLNRLVSAMLHDTKIMGICGETALLNEKATWATMIQVYEYYLSHYLAKSFESLFGSVTCLPGCFSMYRLRSADGTKPLLVNNQIIQDYSENIVDTLHMKNLLHLGEDRYLTTLMLKHFPFFKMTFTPDAKCLTNAPDTFSVLLSQRRRWINSTVHNLMELVFLPRLCGFCCFSMRFVVFMDLFSTIVMPAMLGYLAYILYRLAVDSDKLVSTLSIVFLVAPYALQMLVFLIRRQWQHLGWMAVYLLALPMFSLFIPLYAFWHFDDFSWGNTRVVLGEGGRKKHLAADTGKFDPSIIPTRRWEEYEADFIEDLRSEGTSSRPPSMLSDPSAVPLSPGSRISLLHNPTPPRPESRTFPSTTPPQIHPALPPYHPAQGYPSAPHLIDAIRTILYSCDLMQVSKRQLREKVDLFFKSDVGTRHRDFVGKAIELILQDEL
ncbi:hypothetical protein L0F63_001339 [Massospora cicadina]|nr:hypothetical protein L0F63_001339 [Massospora cicadina]